MRRDVRLIGVLAIAVVASAVPALLVARALPPRTVSELVATPPGEFPVVPVLFNQQYPVEPIPLEKTNDGSQRLALETPHFPPLHDVRLEIAVATYVRAPTQTLRLALFGSSGERLGACSIPPSGYHDNATVGQCPVTSPELLRRFVVSAKGQAPLAVYAAKEKERLVAGALVRQHRAGSLGARLGFLHRWIGVVRPPPFSPSSSSSSWR